MTLQQIQEEYDRLFAKTMALLAETRERVKVILAKLEAKN